MFSAATKTAARAGGYQISRSLRFNSADSAYLNRTFTTPTNNKIWTWSGWVKRSALPSTGVPIFGAQSGPSFQYLCFGGSSMTALTTDALCLFSASGANYSVQSAGVYRDVSAWYHIVCAVDTTQATAANRTKLYVNGAEVTYGTSTYPAQNQDTFMNSAVSNLIGLSSGVYFSGYMTEINFIDGQQLTPSSFGETNAQTGVWQPKAYSGSYGTNGFYLNFSDNSNTTAATLGKDYSGNGNNWTPNNFSVSAGAGNDSLVDVPTPYGVDTGAGGEVRGNYCTLNPLAKNTNTALANGNLDISSATPSTAVWYPVSSTIKIPTSGKWYFEAIVGAVDSGAYRNYFGIITDSFPITTTTGIGNNAQGWAYFADTGQVYNNTTVVATLTASVTNDVIGVAFNADAGELRFYKNGSAMGTSALTGFTSSYFFAVAVYGTATAVVNFGQRPFAYTAPSGYKALCTQNLPTPTIGATTATQAGKYFDVVLRNGGGSSGGTYSTTVNMANGALLWDKPRNQASSNYLVDSVRGISKTLKSNDTSTEVTDASWFTGFNSSSFTTGSSDWGTGTTVVDWIWAANGAGSSNTAGSITSTVSANTTSGFSIVTYTGNGNAATVGHGLGIAPQMIIVKSRSSAISWVVYHVSTGKDAFLVLNNTDASSASFPQWNSTAPTSTVFSLSGGGANSNASGVTYVAYCFAPVAGYSAFGSYTGNGSTDGPFVFTNFRPKYVMIKASGSTGGWMLWDGVRNTSNVENKLLYADLSNAEDTYTGLDFLSNGFKIRNISNDFNNSGITFIYAAFAEYPFKYGVAR